MRYLVPLRWDGLKPLSWTLPLVLPVDESEADQFTGQQVQFSLAEGLQIEPDMDGTDELAQPAMLGGGSGLLYSWSSPPALSRWTIEPSQGAKAASVNVLQAWVQTWLSPQIRQERVAIRLNTMQDTVRVRLPKGVKQSSVQTAVDGYKVAGIFHDPGVVVVRCQTPRNAECTLEVCYSLSPQNRSWDWLGTF